MKPSDINHATKKWIEAALQNGTATERMTNANAMIDSIDLPVTEEKPRKHKYNNKKTVVDNIEFASKKEAARWTVLKWTESTGKISNLERQVTFLLTVNGMLVCKYQADFVFQENGETVVEDVKSTATRKNRAYRIKCKLMKAVHSITIKET